MRKLVYQNALTAAQGLKPYTNARHSFALSNVDYADEGEYSLADQKKALLAGDSLYRRLRGTWTLSDLDGKVLDQKRQTIAHVPYVTPRGTMIHNGNAYVIVNQQRLQPGMYTRIKDNGELETHANILPGDGVAHRYFLDPEKGIFYTRLKQAKIPLLPLLRAMGASDAKLREAWGPELLAANMQNESPAALRKYYDRLLRAQDKELPENEQKARLVEILSAMKINPKVTKRTLGKAYESLTPDAIIDATKKLIAVSRGEAESDDRDHLAFQTIVGPEDLVAERLAKDYGGLRRKLFHRASWQGNLKAVPTNALNRQVEAAILHSGLGQSLEEINPAEVFDKQSRISRLGEGGIPSIDAVPDEARTVQPSHFGFMDPIRTPESFKVGVDVHIARSVRKGNDGKIYAPFRNVRTGKVVYKSPQDVADMAVAFPGEMARQGKRAWAMYRGKEKAVLKKDVTFELEHFENAFSSLGNMIPLKSTTKGQRMAMASRMLTQAVPLSNPEAPLVQSGVPGEPGKSFESLYGNQMGAVRATKSGKVMEVNPGSIRVRYQDGNEENVELYQNFPYNRKTYLHQQPLVEVGQQIEEGQMLARSNYTNDRGETALGVNLRVAYLPFRGLNYEDAVVISQSAAKKMTSEHMYQHRLEPADEHKLGKKAYLGLFPGKLSRDVADKFDDDGIILPGTEVSFDEPLILAAKAVEPGRHKVHRRGSSSFQDASINWNHHSQGVVTDVHKGKKGTTVLVKATSPMQVGDKLSGRYGDKGVISDIIPDDQMPHGRDNKPFEILLNPNGVISRTNPTQVVETLLGKLAMATGKVAIPEDFGEVGDWTEHAITLLEQHGLKGNETVIDPETGRKLQDQFGNEPLAGNRFFMKLHHMAESKGQGRGTGGYTMEETPAKGGEFGSKRISMMDTNALLSHGATQVLRDMRQIRGQRNEDFWLAFMQGHSPNPPGVPMVYTKFVNQLQAAGINVVSDGKQTNIMALTDSDVKRLSGNRRVTTGDTVRLEKGMEPIPGGLFDPKLTGGHHGDRWAYIALDEPMPNPVMEEPIRRLLGLTQKKMREVLAGREELVVNGAKTAGPKAIAGALNSMNLKRELLIARAQIKGGKKTERDTAIRKLGYLKAAQRLGIHPREWMLDRVPVIPPRFRPISVMSDTKIPLVSDANYLYKELIDANDSLRSMRQRVDDVSEERLAVYDSFKAVTGLGDPLHPKLQEKRVSGVLRHIFGSSPKYGTVQRRLLSSTVDLVGRAVITPDPDLDMDRIGLPENRAWKVYDQFVIRRLRRRGLPLGEAAKQVKERSPLARRELLNEMEHRPVIMTRAPVLHRFGVMAFFPKLTKDETVHISPLIVKGFNADFDGDAVNYHVPVLEAARAEAIERMLPSKNLLSPSDFKSPLHVAGQEYIAGLYAATAKSRKRKRTHRFLSKKEAIQAYYRGDITVDTPVEIDV